MIELTDELDVECPWCLDNGKLADWDKLTLEECNTREKRRAFISLKEEKVWKRGSKNFYKCPCCGRWTRGNKLTIVNSSNKELEILGREPLVEVVKSEDNIDN